MANNLIFRAKDASTALEKVQDTLGPDAYIIDINNVGNFVEITASTDEPIYRKPDEQVNPRKSLALAKQSLEQFNPEVTLNPIGSAAYTSTLDPEPVIKSAMRQIDDNSEQQELFAENVSQDVRHLQKRLAKPREFGERSPISAELELNETVKKSEPDLGFKPSPAADSSHTSNVRHPILPKRQDTYVFGDLLNLGLSPSFIKKEFGLKEFGGSISRSVFTETVVSALHNPQGDLLFEEFRNLVFLGTPGSGKSTICAKLMHFFGTQYSEKPSVLHVTPEKLFEADRLRFHAKMFNFSFSRKYSQDNAALCLADRQITEIAWEYQMSFANFFAQNQESYPSLKPFLILPAEINHHTLKEVLRVCPMVRTVILNKCDFGRFSIRNLMMLYEKGYKVASLSGDRSVSNPLDMADAIMLHGFVEYTLDL